MTVDGNVAGTSATLTADRMALNNPGTINVGTGATNIVTLQSAAAGRPIDLGGTGDPNGVLQLSNDELNIITAGVLRIGDAASGDLSVTAPISPANVAVLSLTTGGAVLNPNTVEPDVAVADLAVQAADGISLNTQASELAFRNTAGAVGISNTGALDVADVDGLTASANAGGATSLGTVGALTFSVAVTSSGALTITTTNTAGATDGAVMVAAAGGVQSTGGAVTLTAAAGLNILGPVSAATALQLTGTGALDVSAALTGTPVVVTGNGAGDVFTISPAGSSPLVLVGLGAGDTFNELPPETTPISIYSGAGAVLNYEASGAPLGVATDRVSANVSDPTTYSGVQTVYFNDAAAVAEGPGPDTADRDTAFAGLTSQEHFVQALYLDDLGRAGSKAELDVWVAMLNAPGGSQTAVASALGRSAEAETHLVRGWYAAYLGRSAVGGEEQGWVNQLLSGQTEEQVLGGFLATPEFYAHAQTLSSSGSADTRFVQALYQLLIDRGGEASGVASWVSATSLLGRQEAARRFLGALEFRTDDFEADYNVLLHRPSDPTTLQAWVNSGPDVGAVRAQVAGGAEFFSNG